MNTSESGNVPRMTRWSTPKKYPCTHKDCKNRAVILSQESRTVHNCCTGHPESECYRGDILY